MAEVKLKAALGLDSSGFSRGLDGAVAKTKGFQSQVSGVGRSISSALGSIGIGVGIGAAVTGLKNLVKSLGDIADKADNIGVSTDVFQALQFAATDTGVQMERLEQMLIKARAALGKLDDSAVVEAFSALGLSVSDLSSMAPEDVLARIGRGLSTTKDEQVGFNAVTTIFGERIGPRVLSTLKTIAGDGLDSYIAKAKDAGAVTSEMAINMADAWDASIQKMKMSWKAFAAEVLLGSSGNLVTLDADEIRRSTGQSRAKAAMDAANNPARPPMTGTPGAAGYMESETAKWQKEQQDRKNATDEALAGFFDEIDTIDDRVADELDRAFREVDAAQAITRGTVFRRDNVESIGGQIGGAGRADFTVAQDQLSVLRNIEAAIQELTDATAGGGGAI